MTTRSILREFIIYRPRSVKNIARALELTYEKAVYFSLSEELTRPRRIHITRGDGNCYFRALSFILRGAENQHVVVRDRVVCHMQSSAIASQPKHWRLPEQFLYKQRWCLGHWCWDYLHCQSTELWHQRVFVTWAKSSLGKDFPHSSLWASQLMHAFIWITVWVTTTTLLWVFSDIWWTNAAVL